jgi:c-di-AMP phosphodiesterase-like protein
MALRLAEELNSIISNESICEEAVKLAKELLSDLEIDNYKVYTYSIYDPVREFAANIGAIGFDKWQSKLEDAIIRGSTSTEIFMALKWYLEEMLKNESSLPEQLRKRAIAIRDSLNQSLKVYPDKENN